MGRDDARAVGGLQGGTAPARAFHDFMVRAVANRPVEQFETEVPMPNWQLEPGEETYLGNEGLPFEPLVDENGNPIGTEPIDPLAPEQRQPSPQGPTEPDQTELDRIFGGELPPPERPLPAPRPERVPPSAPADGTQRRPEPTQF
jgi:penicillin-binding protein 1A